MSLYSNKLYMDITISRSSALSMDVLLIFYMPDLTGALFLKTSLLFIRLFKALPAAVILPFTTKCASL